MGKTFENMVVGLDASRNRSGGGKAHTIGILKEADPHKHIIREVHVWAYRSLLEAIPDRVWLIKHNPKELEQSLFHQVWWQRFRFPMEAREAGCSIVFNTDAGSVSPFQPSVTLSQDMLSYEPGVIETFGFSKARLRLIWLRYIQNRSLRNACGSIFLTQYAADVIQRSCGKLSRIAIIPHGVDPAFKRQNLGGPWPDKGKRAVRCLYVSNTALYKHQWVVVRAIAELRKRGHEIRLILAGSGTGRAQILLDNEIALSDPQRNFVQAVGFVRHDKLPSLMANSDLFVFASSCENLPVTLLEAMAVGLPIACSNRGPMPEVLKDGGVYFDPEDANSIAHAVEQLITNQGLRSRVARRAKELSEQYSWARCADETFAFIDETYKGLEGC